jgi:hypothetical protein
VSLHWVLYLLIPPKHSGHDDEFRHPHDPPQCSLLPLHPRLRMARSSGVRRLPPRLSHALEGVSRRCQRCVCRLSRHEADDADLNTYTRSEDYARTNNKKPAPRPV